MKLALGSLVALWLVTACGRDAVAAPGQAAPAPDSSGASSQIRFDHHLLVDQFGYRPGDPKVAVIRDPQTGYDSADKFAP
jgi:endoglucanase